MAQSSEDRHCHRQSRRQSFLWSTITLIITAVRLLSITSPLLPSSSSTSSALATLTSAVIWLQQNNALMSILVRPSTTLSHLVEARAILNLTLSSTTSAPNTNRNSFNALYSTNNAMRIPPLLLKVLLPILDNTEYPSVWLGLLTLSIDICIAILLERFAHRRLSERDGNVYLDEEEELQQELPPSIRPSYDHIFPMYRVQDSSSDNTKKTETSGNDEMPQIQSSTLGLSPSPKISMDALPTMMAFLYYASPFSVLPSTVYQSWQNVPYAFLLLSMYEACCWHGSISTSTFWLSLAVYIDGSMWVYLIPMIGLHVSSSSLSNSSTTSPPSSTMLSQPTVVSWSVILFVIWSVCLQLLSMSLVTGPSNSIYQYVNVLLASYGDAWLPTRPNLSLQWYFHMEIFSRFRTYFGTMFTTIPYVLVGPYMIRFYRYPEVLMASFALICNVFRPVQVMMDGNIALILLLLSPRSLSRMGLATFISICCLFVPVTLNVVDNWMWLSVNNGNANYMFFQCLAYNVFMGIILAQFTSASVQRDKALRMIQKEKAVESESKEKGC